MDLRFGREGFERRAAHDAVPAVLLKSKVQKYSSGNPKIITTQILMIRAPRVLSNQIEDFNRPCKVFQYIEKLYRGG